MRCELTNTIGKIECARIETTVLISQSIFDLVDAEALIELVEKIFRNRITIAGNSTVIRMLLPAHVDGTD